MSADISQIRVLAVDDHLIVREGIAGLLGVQPDMILVGEASNGREDRLHPLSWFCSAV